jgi:hypothetical protein
MSGWDRLKGGKFLPPPPEADAKANVLDRPIGRVDGRSARATGRREQFNPRVHRNFLDGFKAALAEEEKRAGKPVTQGYLLEMMLATWRHERAQGKPMTGPALVLPETVMKAAGALATHLKVTLEDAVSDAIAERMVSAGLAKVKPAGRRAG